MPPPQRSSTGLIVALIVAVVLVAICVGAAIAIWQQAQNKHDAEHAGAASIDQAQSASLRVDAESVEYGR